MLEIPLSNGKFSWSREGRSVSRSLLDRFLVTDDWDESFADTRASRKERLTSDFPILLEADAFEWGPSPFRFCNSWLLDKQCCQIIKNSLTSGNYQGWAGFVIYSKLPNLKSSLKSWFLDRERARKNQEESLLQAFANEEIKVESLNLSSLDKIMKLSIKLDLLARYRREERDLIQKCKLNWLKLGDENTSFFHCFLTAKKRRSLISELIDDQDTPTVPFNGIESLIIKFYKSLYTKSPQGGKRNRKQPHGRQPHVQRVVTSRIVS